MKLARYLVLALLAQTMFFLAPGPAEAAPAHDTQAGAKSVNSLPFRDAVRTETATDDPASQWEAENCPVGRSVWYKYTAPASGFVVAHTRGSRFDTVIKVVGRFGYRSCDDDTARLRSSARVHVNRGETVYFQVGGFDGASGVLRFSLSLGSALSGVVSSAVSGAPLAAACVYVSGPSGSVYERTSTTGFYRVAGVDTGEYRVQFDDCFTRTHAPETYRNGGEDSPGTPVYVGEDAESQGINAELDRASFLKGVVRSEATDLPIGNVCVQAFDAATGRYRGGIDTSPTGFYTIGGLPAGTYNVQFHPCQTGFVSEWWNDAAAESAATPVDLGIGVTATLSPALARSAAVQGVVTEDGTGAPLANVCVAAYDDAGASTGFGYTTATGFYTVADLRPGSVRLGFRPCDEQALHAAEFTGGSFDLTSAAPVPLTSGQTATASPSLGRGRVLKGLVRDGAKQPIPDECVHVQSPDGSVQIEGFTSPTGSYRIAGLAPTSFLVRFGGCRGLHGYEWNGNAATAAASTPVNLALRDKQANAVLDPAGLIKATVRDAASGKWLSPHCVNVEGADAYRLDRLVSGSHAISGTVRFSGLRTGSYRVVADGSCYSDYDDGTGEPADGVATANVRSGVTRTVTLNVPSTDRDHDGLADILDSCPVTPNSDQVDADRDDRGDACEPPELRVADVVVDEGTDAQEVATFRLRLSDPRTVPVSVSYATFDGSAVRRVDYRGVVGRVTFAPGEVEKTVVVRTVPNAEPQVDRSFELRVFDPENVRITDWRAEGLILDDD